jgi:CheY-like chemotaxis protein
MSDFLFAMIIFIISLFAVDTLKDYIILTSSMCFLWIYLNQNKRKNRSLEVRSNCTIEIISHLEKNSVDRCDLEKFFHQYSIGLAIFQITSQGIKMVYANNFLKSIQEKEEEQEEILDFIKKFKTTREIENKLQIISLYDDISELTYEKTIRRYSFREYKILVHSSLFQEGEDKKFKLITIECLDKERRFLMQNIYQTLKSQFLLTISHELNNPLNGLLHYGTKLIEGDSKKKPKYLNKIKMFKFSIKFFLKILTLTSKILLKDKIPLKPENFNLGNTLDKILNKFETFYDSKKIKHSFDISSCKNVYLNFDYHFFKIFLKTIFMFVCYKLKDNKNFRLEANIIKERQIVRFEIKKQNTNCIIDRYLNTKEEEETYYEYLTIENSINTKEILQEIIETLSNLLKIKVSFRENNYNMSFISFEIPYCELNENIDLQILEFSPGTVSLKNQNFLQVQRTLQSHTIEKEIPLVSSTTIQHNILLRSPEYELSIKSQKTNFNFFSKNLHKEIDENGIKKLKSLISYPKDTLYKENALNILTKDNQLPMSDEYLIKSKIPKLGLIKREKSLQMILEKKSSNESEDNLNIDNYLDQSQSNKLLTYKQKLSYKKMFNQDKSPEIYNFKIDFNLSLFDKIKTDYFSLATSPNVLFTPIQNKIGRKCFSNLLKPILKSKKMSPILLKTPLQRRRILKANKQKLKENKNNSFKVIKDVNPILTTERSTTSNCACRKILIVDDEKFNILSIKHLFKGFNIKPDVSSNGREAVDAVKHCLTKTCCLVRYKLILMDVMMPIMDGIEASKQIQSLCKEYGEEDMSIVVVSAHDSQMILQRLKNLQIIKEFVSKPINRNKIQTLIKDYYN